MLLLSQGYDNIPNPRYFNWRKYVKDMIDWNECKLYVDNGDCDFEEWDETVDDIEASDDFKVFKIHGDDIKQDFYIYRDSECDEE